MNSRVVHKRPAQVKKPRRRVVLEREDTTQNQQGDASPDDFGMEDFALGAKRFVHVQNKVVWLLSAEKHAARRVSHGRCSTGDAG